MKECTLQEAIEISEKNGGGRFAQMDSLPFPWIILLSNGWVVTEDKGERVELNNEIFKATWIYEPPKQSAFQKWNQQDKDSVQTVCRREGWNAALDEVLETMTIYGGGLRDLVEKLKEG